MDARDACEKALTEFFRKKLQDLNSDYSWKIPPHRLKDFPVKPGASGYDANVNLKRYLHKRWQESDIVEHYGLACYVVDLWGGVRHNKTRKIINIVNAIAENKFDNPFNGIATYSKIRSIEDPNRYAIFDARVAASLNAVQWNAGHTECGLAFHYPSGQNNVTGNAKEKSGFAHDKRFLNTSLQENGWEEVPEEGTFTTYIEILSSCLRNLQSDDAGSSTPALYDLEMALFSNAESECRKAMGFQPEKASDEVSEPANSARSNVRTGRKMRPKMNFQDMGIPVGSVLLFQDNETEVEVVAHNKVRWNNQVESLWAVTGRLTGRERPGQPAMFWTFEGEKLINIYNRTYPHGRFLT